MVHRPGDDDTWPTRVAPADYPAPMARTAHKGAPAPAAKRTGNTRRRRRGSRYTAPIPRQVRVSPKWLPPLIGLILAIGVLMIILNYFDVLPDSPTNWYLLGGIVIFAGGFGLATQWH